MKNSKLLLTSLLAAATMISVPAFGAGEIISINFGKPDTANVVDGTETGTAGLATISGSDTGVSAGGWTNASGQNGTVSTLKNYNGETIAGASVAWTCGNAAWGPSWENTDVLLNAIQSSYLDLSANNTWNISVDTPFLVCDVYLYFSGDGSKYSPVNVNGISYIGGTNVLAGTATEWGDRRQTTSRTLTLGTNAILVTGTAGIVSLANVPQNDSAKRATISGLQIINSYAGTATSATLAADAAWTTTQLGSAAWTNSTAEAGKYADITLSADVSLSASEGIVTDGIVVSGGHTLMLSAAEGNTAGIDLIGPGIVRVADGSTLSLASGTVLNFSGAASQILGAVSGTGSLVAKSASLLNLLNATLTDFTGTVSAESGATLYLGNGLAGFDGTSQTYALDLASDARLKLGLTANIANSVKLGQSGYAGRVNITAGQFTINKSDIGAGTWVLEDGVILRQFETTVAGSTTYDSISGITTINNDMVVNSGTVEFRVNAGDGANHGNKLIYAGDVSGAGTLNRANNGVVDFTGSVSLSGFKSSGGTTNFNSSSTVYIDAVTVTGGTANFNGTSELGSIAVSGGTANILSNATLSSSSANNNKSISVSAGGTLNIGKDDGSAMTVTAERFFTNDSGTDGTNTVNIKAGATLNITGSANASDSRYSSILIGHWNGTSNVNVAGALSAADAVVNVSWESGKTAMLTVKNGGKVSALGIGQAQSGRGTANFVMEDGGTLELGASGITKNMTQFQLGAGTFRLTDNWSSATTQAMTLSSAAGTTFDTNGFSATLNGALSDVSGVAGALKKTGAGTLTLGGANTYTGATVVEAGTLVAGNATAFGSADTAALTVKTGAAVGVGAGVSLKDLTLESGTKLLLGNLAADGTAFTVSGTASVAENLTIDAFGLASGTYTVVSGGGSIDWSWLDASDFVLNGTHQTISNINTTTSAFTISFSNIDLVWNGTDGDTWSNGGEKVWTVTGSATESDFMNGDNVTFDKNASVAVDAGGVTAGKVTIASDKTVTLTGGNVTAQSGFELQTGATLSLGAGSANGATATLADNSVYAITASTTGEVALGNVSGTGTLKFAGVGNLTDDGGNDPAFSTVAIGSGFTGTVEITAGLVDMLTDGVTSAILPSRLGSASKVVLNGGGLLFRNTNNTNSESETYTEASFSKAIEVGAVGGVIRVYGDGNVTLASGISGAGTLKHTDGGTLTLTGTVNMTGGFSQVRGTTNFNGRTTLGTLSVSGGTLNATRLLVSAGEATANGTIAAGSVTISGGTVSANELSITVGALNISGGTVSATTLNISGGTTTISGGTTTATNGTTVGNGAVLEISTGGQNSALRGTLTVNSGGKVKLMAGDATGWGGTNAITKLELNEGAELYITEGYGTGIVNTAGKNQTFNMSGGIELTGAKITGTTESGKYSKFDLYNENTGITVHASSVTSEIATALGLRKSGSITVEKGTTADGVDLLISGMLTNSSYVTTGSMDRTSALTKSGAGTMKLTGDNQYWTRGGSVTEGTLIAASTTALGKGGTISVSENATLGFVAGTTVDMLKTTTTNGVTTTTNGAIQLASGAKIVVDMLEQDANQEEIVLDLVSGAALSYNGRAVTADNVDTLLGSAISLKNWGEGWTQELSYIDSSSTLRLTLTIPEPSVFGLLAGLGALALAGTRRRRKKA